MASTDNDGFTALIPAADGGHEAVARALLLHGANVDAAATTGKTGLVHAAFRGHEAVSKLLLDHGADLAEWQSLCCTFSPQLVAKEQQIVADRGTYPECLWPLKSLFDTTIFEVVCCWIVNHHQSTNHIRRLKAFSMIRLLIADCCFRQFGTTCTCPSHHQQAGRLSLTGCCPW